MAGENFLYYKLRNNTAELWQSDGAVTIYNYNTSSQCLYDLRSYQNDLFFQTVILADANGYSYLINLDNTDRYFLTGSNLHFEFVNGTALNIPTVSSVQAIRDFQYVSNVEYNLKIEEKILNRNKKYIGAEYSIDIVNGYFPTFASARQYINEGDILIFSEGEYEEDFIMNITGVDFYLKNENVIFNFTDNTVRFSGINRIFGKGKIIQGGTSTTAVVYFEQITDNLFSFISLSYLYSDGNRSMTTDTGKCFVKIKTMETADNSHGNIDTDSASIYADLDVFEMIHLGSRENIFPITNSGTNEYFIRGCKFTCSGASGNINVNYETPLILNLVNCFMVNTGSGVSAREHANISSTGSDLILTLNLWNCFFATDSNAHTFYHNNQGVAGTLNLYSNIYAPMTYIADSPITETKDGEIIIENNISSVL